MPLLQAMHAATGRGSRLDVLGYAYFMIIYPFTYPFHIAGKEFDKILIGTVRIIIFSFIFVGIIYCSYSLKARDTHG